MQDERVRSGPDPTTFTTEWLPGWLRKRVKEMPYKVYEVAQLCGVTETRLRQVRLEKNPSIAPPELLWRLTALSRGEEEMVGLNDDQIRGALSKLITGLGPTRLAAMAATSSSRLEHILDLGELELLRREEKREGNRPVTTPEPEPTE